MAELKKLHLGCADRILDGFINIDMLPLEGVDLIENVETLESFQDSSIDLIYASHVLEHISRKRYKDVLKRWYDLLNSGGVLRLSVPDLKKWFEYYFESGDFRVLLSALYGGQKDKYDYHCMGWDEKTLSEDLLEVGFKTVKKYKWQDTEHSHVRDWSCDYLPYHNCDGAQLSDNEWFKGKFVSLNIEATK